MSLSKDLVIRTKEMHTGGDPVRIVTSGFPPIVGSTVLEKIRYARDHLQHVRDFLTLEPRGHHDMFGAVIVETDHPEADIGIIIINSGDYFNMCGHVTFGVARYAVDHGYTKQKTDPETPVNVQLPCGLVRAFVETKDGKTGPRVRFHSVPVFAAKLDLEVDVEGVGKMKVDISYGGMFFAICDVKKLGLDIHSCGVDALAQASDRIVAAVSKVYTPTHPDHPDLGYLAGSLLTDGGDGAGTPAVHVHISTYKQIARSTCGSGTSARLAAMYARGQIKLGQKRTFQSGITGTTFTGMPHNETTCGQYSAIVVELSTCSYYTGNCEFTLEDVDPLKGGFHVKQESP